MNAPTRVELATACWQPLATAASRPLAILRLRAWARATLWQAGEFDLQTVVDALQEAAAASGLTAAVGQDAVQRILADAFRQVSDDSGAT